MKIYAISGLGADKRVFDFLSLDYEIIPVDWIKPYKNEPIEKYSKRLSKAICTKDEYVILGVSFGGLIATEISKSLNPKLTILVSSAENYKELPEIYRIIGKIRLAKVIPSRFFIPPKIIAHFLFGAFNKELLNNILEDTDPYFTKWAINEILKWKNTQNLVNVLKISGSKDKILPPKKSLGKVLIQNGEHFMIVDKAKEISALINKKLEALNI
jgi:pimeloyl-ACP methyl ester carboxylesterase